MNMKPDLNKDLAADFELMMDCTRRGGVLAQEYFKKGVKSWDKGDDHPVTEADIAVDTLLKESLMGARPNYGWLSEETADDLGRLECRRVWIVDPIDGTRAFMRNVPEYAVCVALVENGRPLMGAVYNPAREEMFEAVIHAGARLNGETISPSEETRTGNASFLTSKRNMEYFNWPKAVDEMRYQWINSIAYRMALVACGRHYCTISMNGKSDWDIAAAELIVTEAGAECSTSRGDGFTYNTRRAKLENVIASTPGIHQAVLDTVGY